MLHCHVDRVGKRYFQHEVFETICDDLTLGCLKLASNGKTYFRPWIMPLEFNFKDVVCASIYIERNDMRAIIILLIQRLRIDRVGL